MLQQIIIQFSRYMFAYEGLKTRKFQIVSSKSSRSRLLEVVADKRFQILTVTWLGNFWYFGKLVAEEKWSLTRQWSQPEARLYLTNVLMGKVIENKLIPDLPHSGLS